MLMLKYNHQNQGRFCLVFCYLQRIKHLGDTKGATPKNQLQQIMTQTFVVLWIGGKKEQTLFE